ncbi:hypothetical protein J5N97_010274 [Dioscorea zingiberensis]|uniref:C2H2-type domain-containing protein n=1 Tax=Dioscorea zingiberensis TaxID=325984 RepID=A0A9D5CZS5_9LILI|nr:hypothetical protein J5N97_010274 [Dioscorea zingiberensis]
MDGDQEQRHTCKVCAKSFPCGRSLGGHMRSHLASNSSLDAEEKPQSSKSYGLRENPRKSCKLSSSSSLSSSEEEEEEYPCSSSEIEKEEEVVALSLMMLSRDTGSWIGFNPLAHESSDKNSIVFEDNAKDASKNVDSGFVSDNEYDSSSKCGGLKRSRYECKDCNKTFETYQALGGHRASHKRSNKHFKNTEDIVVGYSALKKVKTEHQCSICGKVFGSGQALGGHKRSHIASVHQQESPLMSELLDLNLPAAAAVDEESNNSNANAADSNAPWWIGNLE